MRSNRESLGGFFVVVLVALVSFFFWVFKLQPTWVLNKIPTWFLNIFLTFYIFLHSPKEKLINQTKETEYSIGEFHQKHGIRLLIGTGYIRTITLKSWRGCTEDYQDNWDCRACYLQDELQGAHTTYSHEKVVERQSELCFQLLEEKLQRWWSPALVHSDMNVKRGNSPAWDIQTGQQDESQH